MLVVNNCNFANRFLVFWFAKVWAFPILFTYPFSYRHFDTFFFHIDYVFDNDTNRRPSSPQGTWPNITTYMETVVRIRLHKSYMSGLASHHSPHFSTKAFSDGYSRLRTRLPSIQYHMYHTLSFFDAVFSFITIYFKGLNNRFLSMTELQVTCLTVCWLLVA